MTWTGTTVPLASPIVYLVVAQISTVQCNASKEPAASSFRREDGVQWFLRNVDRSHIVPENLENSNMQVTVILAKIYLLNQNKIN
jgi:hypothetical protein